ncbi:MAG: hypothetical protein QXN93_06250 [Methanomassiliicoccales archaeon]
MEEFTKKITEGKGAFSLYIPKKWINRWRDIQLKERNVRMILLEDFLVITPVHKSSFASLYVSSHSVDDIKRFILASYIKGFEGAELIAADRFSDEQIMGSRDFVRFLDERISLDATEKRIELKFDNPREGTNSSFVHMRSLIFDKLGDAFQLLKELIEYFDRNARRSLHIMQILRLLEEDIDKLVFRILRQASRFEMPIETISDLHFVSLTVSYLESMSDSVFGIVRSVCGIYEIDYRRLSFPTDVLMRDVVPTQFVRSGDCEAIKKLYMAYLDLCKTHINKIYSCVVNKNPLEAFALKEDLVKLREKIIDDMNNKLDSFFKKKTKEEPYPKTADLLAIGHRIADIITKLEELAKLVTIYQVPMQSEITEGRVQ